MSKSPPSILDVGSVNMDLVLRSERVPLVGESLIGQEYVYVPGGKGANQAVAAARLGAEVTFVGRIGADAHGSRLKAELQAQGISTDLVRVDTDAQTGLAVIMLEHSGENRILVYPGANMSIRREDIEPAFEQRHDAVMITLEIPPEVVISVCSKAREKQIPTVLDAGPAQPFDLGQVRGLEILSPNETETVALTGKPCRTPDEAEAAARVLAELAEARFVVIKLGEQGALLHGEGKTEFVPAYTVDVVDSTAAGDSFTAAMTVHFLQHGDIREAVRYANGAGALAVTRLGAQPSMPEAKEVEQFLVERSAPR